MTDIVIPLGYCHIPENQNNVLPDSGELRYCLRSIEKHLKNVGRIFIVGPAVPSWIQNIDHIRCGDREGKQWHEWNIYNKIKVGSLIAGISDPFLFMNDDQYLLQDFDANTFPYFYEKTIKEYQNGRVSAYQNTNLNTCSLIGSGVRYYDVHCPVLYTRSGVEALRRADWERHYGYLIKSVYAAWNNIEGEPCEDLKIGCVVSLDWLNKMIPGKKFFSTADNCFGNSVKEMMEILYGEKSKYEI